MSRRLFVVESVLTLLVVSLLSSRGAQAQNGISITPGQIVKWLDAQGDLTDSVISEDPTTGNIGIGTTSPSRTLTVVGNGISVSRSGASAQISVESSGGGIASFSAIQDGTNTILLRGDTGNSFINTGGNVGIGTTNPSRTLTVVGNGISVSRSGASAQISVESSGAGIASFSAIQNGANTILLRGDTGNSFINTGGNVGIGTTNPSRTLTVVGNGISVSRSGAGAQISVESSGAGF